jgi:hypothetical protein
MISVASTDNGTKNSPFHMLKRFLALRVSTLCIRPTSTVNTGVSNREGIVWSARLHEMYRVGRHDCCDLYKWALVLFYARTMLAS